MKEAVDAMDKWMDRFDAVVIGPGLGRDELVHETVRQASQFYSLAPSLGGSLVHWNLASQSALSNPAIQSLAWKILNVLCPVDLGTSATSSTRGTFFLVV